MKQKVKKRIGIALVGVVFVGLVIGGWHGLNTLRYWGIINRIELSTPDFSQLEDGVFEGSFDAILVAAEVTVTVENQEITDIVINEHHHGRDTATQAERIIDDVISTQSLEVDGVSGATNSSLVILSAVYDALTPSTN